MTVCRRWGYGSGAWRAAAAAVLALPVRRRNSASTGAPGTVPIRSSWPVTAAAGRRTRSLCNVELANPFRCRVGAIRWPRKTGGAAEGVGERRVSTDNSLPCRRGTSSTVELPKGKNY